MINVSGKCKVYKIEHKGNYNFVTASLMSSKKLKDGEYENQWFNAKFVGKAFEPAKHLQDKAKIEIKSGVLESRKHEGKTYITIVVFEFDSEEQPMPEQGFTPVDDDEDIPF